MEPATFWPCGGTANHCTGYKTSLYKLAHILSSVQNEQKTGNSSAQVQKQGEAQLHLIIGTINKYQNDDIVRLSSNLCEAPRQTRADCTVLARAASVSYSAVH